MTLVTTDNTKVAAAIVAGVIAPAPRPATLGQLLVGADIITPEQLDRALAEGSQKGLRLGEALVDMGMVQEDAILPFIEGHLGVPATRLRDGIIDPVAVRLVPRRVAERLDVLALFKVRESLCVAMADPQNLEQIDEIERVTHLRVRPVFAFRSSIQRALPRCYDEGFEVDTVTADIDEGAVQLQADGTDVDMMNVEALVDGSPIINLVNYLLDAGDQGRGERHPHRAQPQVFDRPLPRRRPDVRGPASAPRHACRRSSRASRSWARWTSPSIISRRTAASK